MNNTWRRIEIGILGFTVVSAVPIGLLMMIFPGGIFKEMPVSMLENSPFGDFFWPGLILFGIIGLGHAAALVLGVKRHPLFGPASAVMGLGLMIWIFVQVNMIGGGHWLQHLYFAVGILEVSLAVLLLKNR
jgi:hypothetical protein